MDSELMRAQDVGANEPGFEKLRRRTLARGSTADTVEKYAGFLGMVRRIAGKPLLSMSVREAEDLGVQLAQKAGILRAVTRMFYKVNGRPKLRDALEGGNGRKERIGVNEILNPAEVVKMADRATNARDRCLILTLGELGSRIGETLATTIGDVRGPFADGVGFQLYLRSVKVKGQERFAPTMRGALHDAWVDSMRRWLKAHPQKGDKAAPLFPSMERPRQAPSRTVVARMLKDVAKKAGLVQDVHPHLIRHSRASWGVANHENLGDLSQQMWGIPMSNMLNHYSHFNGARLSFEAVKTRARDDLPALPASPEFVRVAQLEREMEALRAKADELDALKTETAKLLGILRANAGKAVTDESGTVWRLEPK